MQRRFREEYGILALFVSRNPRNLRQEFSSLVSTSFTYSGDEEDSGDSGIIPLLFLLESPESSHRTQLRNVRVLHCFWCFGAHVAARAKRRVVRGRTGESREFWGLGLAAGRLYFPIFSDACLAVYTAL